MFKPELPSVVAASLNPKRYNLNLIRLVFCVSVMELCAQDVRLDGCFLGLGALIQLGWAGKVEGAYHLEEFRLLGLRPGELQGLRDLELHVFRFESTSSNLSFAMMLGSCLSGGEGHCESV